MEKRTKRSTRLSRSPVAELLETPSPKASPPGESPKASPNSLVFGRKKKMIATCPKSKRILKTTADPEIASTASVFNKSPPNCMPSTISDLKDLASSRIQDLRRHIEHSHSQILKELGGSYSHLNKRFKLQTQACQQLMDDAEKEYKKMSERIREAQEAMTASYEEFMAHEQASASRVCKTSVAELSQSVEKGIDVLRSRFAIPST